MSIYWSHVHCTATRWRRLVASPFRSFPRAWQEGPARAALFDWLGGLLSSLALVRSIVRKFNPPARVRAQENLVYLKILKPKNERS
jgi:hypothetical protein